MQHILELVTKIRQPSTYFSPAPMVYTFVNLLYGNIQNYMCCMATSFYFHFQWDRKTQDEED
jgi:hypothetical protein